MAQQLDDSLLVVGADEGGGDILDDLESLWKDADRYDAKIEQDEMRSTIEDAKQDAKQDFKEEEYGDPVSGDAGYTQYDDVPNGGGASGGINMDESSEFGSPRVSADEMRYETSQLLFDAYNHGQSVGWLYAHGEVFNYKSAKAEQEAINEEERMLYGQEEDLSRKKRGRKMYLDAWISDYEERRSQYEENLMLKGVFREFIIQFGQMQFKAKGVDFSANPLKWVMLIIIAHACINGGFLYFSTLKMQRYRA